MSEMQNAMRMLSGKFSTCIQQVNYPIHKGEPNPSHGRFFFVGSIPSACYDQDAKRSLMYDSEQAAIDAALAAGAERVQGVDCRRIK